jgi:hypothetical protein
MHPVEAELLNADTHEAANRRFNSANAPREHKTGNVRIM